MMTNMMTTEINTMARCGIAAHMTNMKRCGIADMTKHDGASRHYREYYTAETLRDLLSFPILDALHELAHVAA